MSVVAILGPTASGKSAVAEAAADRFGAVILSVDSMQVFTGLDIGTAKPSVAVRNRIDHHMIDIADPRAEFSVMEFQMQGRQVLQRAHAAGWRVIIAGGSGLHFRSLVDPLTFAPTDRGIREELEALPLDELQHELLALDHRAPNVVDLANPRRVIRAIEVWRITGRSPTERAAAPEAEDVRAYRALIPHVSIGLDARGGSQRRVAGRFDRMLGAGLLEEVSALAPTLGRTASQAVGYRELLRVVGGHVTVEEAREEAVRATNALVKRQRTFFGRDPRIVWIPWQDEEDARIESVVDSIGEATGWTS